MVHTHSSEKQEDNHWFGFEKVSAAEKTERVKGVFNNVAKKYDLMNDIMSLGIHRLWKNNLMNQMRAKAGDVLLDVAGGTGDIGFRFIRDYPDSKVIFCDLNENMLRVGRDRAYDKGMLKGLEWVVGNAESIPLPSNSVDFYTIAFGFRNVTHREVALKEALRVLKPGGRFFCLEFSHLSLPVLQKLYDQYSFHLLPLMGKIFASDAESYQYLAESIRQFPRADDLKKLIEEAGFYSVTYELHMQGIAALHKGWKV